MASPASVGTFGAGAAAAGAAGTARAPASTAMAIRFRTTRAYPGPSNRCRCRLPAVAELVRRATILAGALLVLGTSAVAEAAPAPLSEDGSPADVGSRFGSGAFGRWTVDPLGLPAFRYRVDQERFPPARQPELQRRHRGAAPARQRPHRGGGLQPRLHAALEPGPPAAVGEPLGPGARHYGGGLRVPERGRPRAEHALPRPPARRGDASGSSAPATTSAACDAAGLDVRERVYAPVRRRPAAAARRDDPQPLRGRARRASWFEYWDVNPYIEATGPGRAVGTSRGGRRALRTLSVRQAAGDLGDRRPLSIFAAALRGPGGRLRDVRRDGSSAPGTRAAPAAVAADRLSGRTAAPRAAGCSRSAPRSGSAPGQSITLRYAYGMAHPAPHRGARAEVPARSRSVRARSAAPLGGLAPAGRASAPGGPGSRASSSGTRTCCAPRRSTRRSAGTTRSRRAATTSTARAANLGSRSWLHYLLPMVYAEPALAREILRFTVGVQSKAEGTLPYGLRRALPALQRPRNVRATSTSGCSSRPPSTGSARATWASSASGTRSRTRPRESVWEHVKIALPPPGVAPRAARRVPRGDERRLVGRLGAAAATCPRPTLVAAQLAYAYPRLADLADLRGDRAFAATASPPRA